jgi:hypothetical protein
MKNDLTKVLSNGVYERTMHTGRKVRLFIANLLHGPIHTKVFLSLFMNTL